MYMMEAGSQTDPLETEVILNLLEEKSIELLRTSAKQNEIQKVIDDTKESSPNPKNELECEKVSCMEKDWGLASTSSPTEQATTEVKKNPSASQMEELEERHNFTRETLFNTDTSCKPRKKPFIGRSHSFKGSPNLSSSTSKLCLESYCRRASGGQALIRASRNASGHVKLFQSESCYGYPPTSSQSQSTDKCRRSGGKPCIIRQSSTTLSIPSRQASVRSCSSARSYNSSEGGGKGKINTLSNTKSLNHLGRHGPNSASMKSLPYSRESRSNSIFSTGGIPLKDLPPKERRHKKVAYAVFFVSSFLLLVSVLCIIISLQFSPRIDERVRKENESLMSIIRPTESTMNASSTTPVNSISSKEVNFGGIGGSGGTRTTTASSTELVNEYSNSANHNQGPPIVQSLIVETLLQKRQFRSKTTGLPKVLNQYYINDVERVVSGDSTLKRIDSRDVI